MANIKNIMILLLIIILIICLIFGFYLYYQNIEKNKKLKEVEEKIIERDKEVEKLKNKPPVIIKEFVKLPYNEKDEVYARLYTQYQEALSIIDNDKIIIDDLKKLIKKDKKHGISLFAAGGTDKTLTPEILLGGTYDRLFQGNLLSGKLCFGGYVKVYENQGGGLIIGGGFSW